MVDWPRAPTIGYQRSDEANEAEEEPRGRQNDEYCAALRCNESSPARTDVVAHQAVGWRMRWICLSVSVTIVNGSWLPDAKDSSVMYHDSSALPRLSRA